MLPAVWPGVSSARRFWLPNGSSSPSLNCTAAVVMPHPAGAAVRAPVCSASKPRAGDVVAWACVSTVRPVSGRTAAASPDHAQLFIDRIDDQRFACYFVKKHRCRCSRPGRTIEWDSLTPPGLRRTSSSACQPHVRPTGRPVRSRNRPSRKKTLSSALRAAISAGRFFAIGVAVDQLLKAAQLSFDPDQPGAGRVSCQRQRFCSWV